MNLSVLVGLYNNLDYTQHFYHSFREIYPTVELVFVSYGSTDDTGIWLNLIESIDPNVIVYWENKRKTFSDTYNKAAELATKKYICFAHNDMVVAPGWLENIEKNLKPNSVVSYTTIEPPIFNDHQRPGKIVKDYGDEFTNFPNGEFLEFVKNKSKEYENQTSEGISFFNSLQREQFLKIGGFDNKFNPYFCEDDDLIRRLKLLNLNCFTALDSFVYHLVSKTSRFSEEAKQKTQEIEYNSNRTYLRKWGSLNSNNFFNVGFDITNADYNIIHHLEPWCSFMYTDYTDIQKYIDQNQNKTWFNLQEKFISREEFDSITGVIVKFDASKLTQQKFEFLQNIQNILGEITEIGEYEFDIFNVEIKELRNYINDNIYI